MDRNDHIKLNLQSYLPYVCECVDAKHLLQHLDYFSGDERCGLNKLSRTDPREATRKAFDILMQNDSPGVFTALLESFEDEYPKIVKLLQGDVVRCDTNYTHIVTLFTPEIIRKIQPVELIDHLKQYNVITEEEAEEAKAEMTNYGPNRAAWFIVTNIHRHIEDWFKYFIMALIDARCKDLAESLDKDMVEKIDFDSTVEKGNLEKEVICPRGVNLDTDYKKKLVGKLGLDSLLNGETACNQMMARTEVKGLKTLTDKDVVYTSDSLAEVKQLENNGNYSNCQAGKKIIRYDREFLLACKDTVLTKTFPKEAEKFPEIMVPLTLPRLPDKNKWENMKKISPPSALTCELSDRNLQSTDIISEHDSENLSKGSENDATTDANGDLLDFGFLLSDGLGTEDQIGITVRRANETAGKLIGDVEETDDKHAKDPTSLEGQSKKDTTEHIISEREQNDLNLEAGLLNRGENSQNVIELNIPTDADDIEATDVDISLRKYQMELAKEGSQGENVIILAPTNTGKTRVACSIMQVHLRRHRQSGIIGKVIFLVENEALAFQQGKVCADLLPAYRTKVISGSVQRNKRQFLKDFLGRRDILVVTAQVLLNALKQKEIESLTSFSLIVFDECHHTDNLHRFNEIMSRYMDLKLRDNLDASVLPQIIGLTASLGVGGTSNKDAAINHMKGLLANLDAKFLCTVRENEEDLKSFENNPDEEIVTARNRQNDPFRQAILDIIEIIDRYMISHKSIANLREKDQFIKMVCRVPPSRGTDEFLQWLSKFKEAIGSIRTVAVCRMLNPCRLHLEVYNKALLVHANARMKDAVVILEEFMDEEMEIEQENETDKMLLDLYRDMKTRNFDDESENPKLLKMQELVMSVLGNDENARAIIFVKTRELAKALVKWMRETAPLNTLNAKEFVGQAASAAEGGMTKGGQKDVLEYFKDGRHKVIIATSVAEEGLDITKCNLVIRYEHVTNEIVRLQSRGRLRARNSKYYVLTTEGSWIVAKEEKNAMLEKLMNSIVPVLQAYIEDHPNLWEQELLRIQEEQKLAEEMKEKKRKANTTAEDMEFQCLNCSKFICMSSDIRRIKEDHHVVIDKDVNTRLVSSRGHSSYIEDELKYYGEIFCGDLECQRRLGGICEYRYVEFPMPKIEHFKVVDKNGQSRPFKQWKKANLEIEQFSLDDLMEVVDRRRVDM